MSCVCVKVPHVHTVLLANYAVNLPKKITSGRPEAKPCSGDSCKSPLLVLFINPLAVQLPERFSRAAVIVSFFCCSSNNVMGNCHTAYLVTQRIWQQRRQWITLSHSPYQSASGSIAPTLQGGRVFQSGNYCEFVFCCSSNNVRGNQCVAPLTLLHCIWQQWRQLPVTPSSLAGGSYLWEENGHAKGAPIVGRQLQS